MMSSPSQSDSVVCETQPESRSHKRERDPVVRLVAIAVRWRTLISRRPSDTTCRSPVGAASIRRGTPVDQHSGKFRQVIEAVGPKPTGEIGQNESRNYSERLSKELALWVRSHIVTAGIGARVMTPEARIPTIYDRGKSLDVGVTDDRGYLLLDLSIKTFNFKDRRTRNYRKNYTGRFYELLGEALDLRRSYKWSTLAAMVFLPEDSVRDSRPSSFAHAVRQFSKACSPDPTHEGGLFDHVFVGLHGEGGELAFVDANEPPPRSGMPAPTSLLSIRHLINRFRSTVESRRDQINAAEVPRANSFRFLPDSRS